MNRATPKISDAGGIAGPAGIANFDYPHIFAMSTSLAHRFPALTVLAVVTTIATAQHARPLFPTPPADPPFATGHAQHSTIRTTLRSATVANSTITTAWATKVVRMSARNHGLPEVNAIKDAKLPA